MSRGAPVRRRLHALVSVVRDRITRRQSVVDCQWIQALHSVGLLRGRFRPTAAIAALRAYLRHRETLVQSAATHVQRMQKALDQMNLQLPIVISDITGVTGLRILRDISVTLTSSARTPWRSLAKEAIPTPQCLPIALHQLLDLPNLRGPEAPAGLKPNRVQPELRGPVISLDMNMWRLVPIAGVEEKAIRPDRRTVGTTSP
jgi:hypothetical protein